MDSTRTGIEAAVLDFLAALRTESKELDLSRNSLEQHPFWAEVRARVADQVSESLRPDLYRDDRLDDEVLMRISGLAPAIQQAVISGDSSHDQDLAADFARFCTRDAPTSEDWILLDVDLPAGTRVNLGGQHIIEVRTLDDLLKAHPLPTATAIDPEAGPMPPRPVAGAAFLRTAKPDRPLLKGHRFPRWLSGTKTELENWLPLLALLLWSPGIMRAEAVFEVEAGRRIALVDGDPAIVEDAYTGADDQPEEYLRHLKQGITLAVDEMPAFTAFTAAVIERAERVLAYKSATGTGSSGRRGVARRLERAGQHLVRAAHRTQGPGVVNPDVTSDRYDEVVSGYEQHEVILHYVIAMEALLADDNNLDLSRKVMFRAATLFGTDDERDRVSKLVKDAYTARSKYAHGDKVPDIDMTLLRHVARQVILRWLILATCLPDGSTAQDMKTVPTALDDALLSDLVRREGVLRPLRDFFAASPPADPPSDLLA